MRPGLEPLEPRWVPTILWIGGDGGGLWNDPNNWRDPTAPPDRDHRTPSATLNDNVSLPAHGIFVVNDIGAQSCTSLSVGADSQFTLLPSSSLNVLTSASFGGSLTIEGGMRVGTDFSVAGPLSLGGTSLLNLSATGQTHIGGDFVWSGGMLRGGTEANPIALNHPTSITGTSTKTLSDAFVTNYSTLTHEGTATLVTNTARLTNVGEYIVDGDGEFAVQNRANFVNEGTLRKSGGTGTSTIAGFQNQAGGVVEGEAGRLELLMNFESRTDGLDIEVGPDPTAVVSINTDGPLGGRFQGTLTASGAGRVVMEGTLYVGPTNAVLDADDDVLEWTGGQVVATEGTLTNAGFVTFDGAGSKRLEGTWLNTGTVRHAGSGVLNIATGSRFQNDGLYELLADTGLADGGMFLNAATLRKSQGTGESAVTPRFFQNFGGRIEVSSGRVRLPSSGAVMNAGHFSIATNALLDLPGGTYTGTFTGMGSGRVRMNQGTLTAGIGGAVLDLPAGLLHLTGAILDGGTQGFTVATTGSLTATQDGASALNGLVRNLGVLAHHPGAGGFLQVNGTFENRGSYTLHPGAGISFGGRSGTFVNERGGSLIKPAGTSRSTITVTFTNPGGTITVGAGTLSFFAPLTNAGGDVAIATGATLEVVVGSYSQTDGTTTIEVGTLRGPAIDISGGTLTGNGTVVATSGVTNGGTFRPGSSPGAIVVNGRYTQAATGTLAVDLNGLTPSMGSNRLTVNGSVGIDGVLAVTLGAASGAGDELLVLENDGTDAVTGTFAGLAEGAELILGSTRFRVSYRGGTGNDVTLTNLGATNAAPSASAGGPYSIAEGDSLTLDASGSSDPDDDPLAYSWDINGDGIFGDAAGVAPALSWVDLRALGIGDGATTWSVRVRVSDAAHPAVTSAAAALAVVDTAPTIVLGGDAGAVEGETFTLRLGTVNDPGDDAVVQYIVHWGDAVDVFTSAGDVTHTYADSDAIHTITVDVVDEDGTHAGVGSRVLVVANRAPVAGLSGPVEAVRGQERGFLLTATDVPADTAPGFTFRLDFGDGGPLETVPATPGNGGGISLGHAYREAGIYTLRLTAIDKDGGTSAEASTTISVTRVALQDDSIHPGQLALAVGGTATDDDIRMARGRSGGIVVRMNGVLEGTFRPTSRLIVYGNQGDDNLLINREINVPAWLYGGDGDDHLTGGQGPNVLLGGEGNDWLTGRNGRDLIIGGRGADRLRGGNGEDLIIAGTTAFDSDELALAAIQAEWLSGRPYALRLANLRGDSSNPAFPSRLNGEVFLLTIGPGVTVFDDGDVDELIGQGGVDAYFANLAAGVLDAIRRRDAFEQAVELD